MSFCFSRMATKLSELKPYMPQAILDPQKIYLLDNIDSPAAQNYESQLSPNSNVTRRVVSRTSSLYTTEHDAKSDHMKHHLVEIHTRKSGTLLAINVKNFHKMVNHSHQSASRFHTHFLEAVLEIIKEYRGIPEIFFGDRLLVSFNVMSTCMSYGFAACKTALSIAASYKNNVDDWLDQSTESGITFGIATGIVNTGVLGCTSMKRLSFVGPVVNMAYLLERLCIKYSTSIMCETNIAKSTETFFYFRIIDCIRFTKFSSDPILIMELKGIKGEVSKEEWMYELSNYDKDDPNIRLNTSWKLYLSGKVEEAKDTLGDAYTPNSRRLQTVIQLHPDGRYVNDSNFLY
eukprot:NODE_2282_length_1627_cov_45.926197_g1958_i0.p1 GENE.NODE_2282_length_1627_cov_45.926197_g1958_i0~~NODE_2282_length_1627_cov_45.926197_g1958_i0.p1  ORF type:complete len:382 (+),score=37.96 NODE_2282_length_1627_cov_45.926197_g1958_i0:111-1148(+)